MTINLSSSFGIRADQVTELPDKDLKMPVPDEQGRVLTLNQTGFMKINLDPISREFINSAKQSNIPALEIGAAFGATSIELLKSGASVIANDIDMRHLMLLRALAPKHCYKHLYLNNQHFPTTMDLPKNAISHILCCRVAHFLTPTEMKMALDKMTRWLTPEGRLFFVIISPYHHRLEKFLPIYKQRWVEGNEWPGVINNVKSFWPEFSADIPDMIHVMDQKPLIPQLIKRGFIVEKTALFDYGPVSNEKNRDGREYFGLIAKKSTRNEM